MKATALAVRDIFEIGNDGQYHVDDNGDLRKGNSLNISQATNGRSKPRRTSNDGKLYRSGK